MIRIFTLALFISFVGLGNVLSQVTVVPASNMNADNGRPGIYYALPMTCFQIEVVVKKTESIPGPYHAYAEKYLGVEDAINVGSVSYEIVDIEVVPFVRPDPDQCYFVEYGERTQKEEESLIIYLSEAGLLAGLNETATLEDQPQIISQNEIIIPEEQDIFKFRAGDNLYQKIDTVVRKITIDTLTIEKNYYKSSWVQKTSEQKAKDASAFIKRIRENRFLLISGYQEVNYGESIKYMDQSLLELENDYLSLFTGITRTATLNYSYLLAPSFETNDRFALFNFSETRGIMPLGGPGQQVSMFVSSSGLNEALNGFVNSKNNNKIPGQEFYYRIPEYANVEIKLNQQSFFIRNLPIYQMGVVSFGPLNNALIQFYPQTGGVKSLQTLPSN